MKYLYGLKDKNSHDIVCFEKKKNFTKALDNRLKYAESMIKQGFESHEFSIVVQKDSRNEKNTSKS